MMPVLYPMSKRICLAQQAALALQHYCTEAGLTLLASEWWHFNELDTRSRVLDNLSTGGYQIQPVPEYRPLKGDPVMEAKYQLNTAENRSFLAEMRQELLDFGRRFPSPGGGSHYLGDDGTPWPEKGQETWITSRMAHVYSIGAMLGDAGSPPLADAAIGGLRGELRDSAHAGWYAGLNADGSVMPTKQCYAHAFVILAASSALLAGRAGAEQLLDDALAVYDLRFWDEAQGLSRDTWDTDFTVLDSYRGLNANMHSVEAFLAAADATGREEYRIRAGRIIDRVLVWAEQSSWRIPEHFSEYWVPLPELNRDRPDDPFKPYGATPGHGIEWARLITQWALSADRKKAAPYIEAAQQLYTTAIKDAWNADGTPGLVYTTDWTGSPVVHDRMHWTLAEAINTSAVLHQVTGRVEYAEDYARFMAYLDEKVWDRRNGSWFHQLDRENRPLGTVWPGKPDLYHAFQATLIPYLPPEVSIASAVHRAAR